MRKGIKNTWHELQEERCPKCKSTLMRNMFQKDYTGCTCGFNIDDSTKKLLTNRDREESYVNQLQDNEISSSDR